jgi:Spy/CpxP family protein refolding chaperone
MKEIVFTLALAACTTTLSFAQHGGGQHTQGGGQHTGGGAGHTKMTAEQRATKVTQYMTTSLALTSDQQTKVTALNITKSKQLDSLRTANAANMEAAKPAMKKVKETYNAGLNSVLTADQKTKWEALKKQKRDEFQKNKAAGTKPTEGEVTPEDVE